jgi:hypothetical protein
MIDSKALLNIIRSKLISGTPFSFVRYGDGEAMFLNQEINKRDAEYVTKRQWNYTPLDVELSSIKAQMIKAYRNADIVGLPTERHLERKDTWGESMRIFDREVCQRVNRASIDACYEMLTAGLLTELLQGRETLNFISCRDLESQFKKHFGIIKTNWIAIAPEMKFASNYTGPRHYPEDFNFIKDMIPRMPTEGNLFLVGAGILGKIYCDWIKQAGGIAVDVGGVMDSWYGLRTRGKGRGVDVEDLEYKL